MIDDLLNLKKSVKEWETLVMEYVSYISLLLTNSNRSTANHQATHNLLFPSVVGLVFIFCGGIRKQRVSNKTFLINVTTIDMYFIFNLVPQLFILHQMSLSLNQRIVYP